MKNSGREQRIALSDTAGRTLTHAALENSIAFCKNLLRNCGIGPGCRVLLLLEKNFQAITLIHSISDLHAVYIPADPIWPQNRIDAIFHDCHPHVVIHCDEKFLTEFPGNSVEIPDCGEIFISLPGQPSEEKNPLSENTAYILYTSGSTGAPKGVCVPRNALNAFTAWCISAFNINTNDAIASVAPIQFDLSVCDIFSSRAVGCLLHLFRKEDVSNPRLTVQEFSERKITFVYATPTFLSSLVHYGKPEKQKEHFVTRVLFAGEVFPVKTLHQLMDLWNHATFYNLYGPTETNVCTYTEIKKDPDRTKPYPIGNVCPAHEIYLEQDGELVVSGPHLASGYLNRITLTEERFITQRGKRWFKTGDIVEKTANGELIFKGRKDRMIKRRGFRIEPGEIEAMAMRIENVKNAACVAVEIAEGTTQIILFAQCVDPENELELRMKLTHVLAESMLPDRIIGIDKIPVTDTGKTDYLALIEYVNRSADKRK